MNYINLIFTYLNRFNQDKLDSIATCTYVASSYLIVIVFLTIGSVFPVGSDPFSYLSVADNFANGPRRLEFYDHFRGEYLKYWMPLYPLLIAIVILLGFDVITAAYVITVGFQGLVVFPLFYFSKDLFHRKIAHVSSIIYITSFPFIYVSTLPVADTLFTFLSVLSLFSLNKALKSANIVQTLTTGAIVGLSFLTKPLGAIIFAFAILCFVLYKNKEEINNLKLLLTTCVFGLSFFVFILSWSSYGLYRKLAGSLIVIIALLCIIHFNSKDKLEIIKKLKQITLFSVGCILTISWWLIRNYLRFHQPLYWGQSWHYRDWISKYGNNLWEAIQYSTSHLQITRIIFIDLFPISVFLIISVGFLTKKTLQKKILFLFGYPILLSLFLSTWYTTLSRLLLSGYPFLIIIAIKTVFELTKLCQTSFKQRWPQFIIFSVFVIHIIYNLYFSYLYFTIGLQIIDSTGLEKYNTLNRPEWHIWFDLSLFTSTIRISQLFQMLSSMQLLLI